MMNGMLVLIMTGPDEEKGDIKVSEGLHILESVAIKGKEKIRIVLKGEGVEWIREQTNDVEKMIVEYLEVLSGLGVMVGACFSSIQQRGLEMHLSEMGIKPVASTEWFSKALENDWEIITF